MRPDKPAEAQKGVRPDIPAGTDTTKQDDLQKQVAVTALKVPDEWNEQKFADVLATRLKALAEKSLPDAKVTVQNDDKGRRIRIEWKTQKYDPQAPQTPPVAVLGARPSALETGPAADGLILEAWLDAQLDLANRPKVLDNGGRWETRKDQVFVLPLKKCLKFDASWGAKTDRQIIATFSTAQRWFEGESVSTQTYVPPNDPATTPNPATSRGARPDRPAPKPQEGPMMPMAGVPAYRPDGAQPKVPPDALPAADAPAPAPPPAPGRAAGVQADRPADGTQ